MYTAYFYKKAFTNYFNILSVEKKESIIFLEEKTCIERKTRVRPIRKHGGVPAILVQNFPLRRKRLLLIIRRRCWLNKQIKVYVNRKIHITANCTRLTQKSASFFNEPPIIMPLVAIV